MEKIRSQDSFKGMSSNPLNKLMRQMPADQPPVKGLGVYMMTHDGKVREVDLNEKLAKKIINLCLHAHGGTLRLSAHSVAISREKEMDLPGVAKVAALQS